MGSKNKTSLERLHNNADGFAIPSGINQISFSLRLNLESIHQKKMRKKKSTTERKQSIENETTKYKDVQIRAENGFADELYGCGGINAAS